MTAGEFGDARLPERFWAKVRPLESGCWEWTAARNSGGYAFIKINGSMHLAHRLAHEALIGPIPEGLTIDHRCHTDDESCSRGGQCPHRRCVNPAHLEPVTQRENSLRGRSFLAVNVSKTECLRGHPYDTANTYRTPKGGRDCRTCRSEATRRSRRRKAAAKAAVPPETAADAARRTDPARTAGGTR